MGALEARFQSRNGVPGRADDGVAGDEAARYGSAVGGRFAKAAGRDGRVEPEGFLDDAVQVCESLETLEIFDGVDRVQFGLDLVQVTWILGQVMEDVDQGHGHSVTGIECQWVRGLKRAEDGWDVRTFRL